MLASSLLELPPAHLARLEPCLFQLDFEGRILAMDAEARKMAPQCRVGDLFTAWLRTLHDQLRVEAPLAGEERLFLSWPEDAGWGLQLQTLPLPDGGVSMQVTPTLAPTEARAENGLAHEEPLPTLWRPLLLKLQQAETRLGIYHRHFPGTIFQQRADLSFAEIGGNIPADWGLNAAQLARSPNAFLDLIFEADREFYLKETTCATERGEAFTLHYRLQLPDSTRIVHLMDVRTPRRSPQGILLGFEGVWLDITRQAIAEKRLTSAGWKENLALLTSGLLHDFRNTMTGISTLSEVYCRTMEDDHPWHEGMTMIRQSASTAQSTVQKIIDLNREKSRHKGYFDLAKLVRDERELLRLVLPRDLNLDFSISEEEIPVFLDESGLRQLILNLVINSRDASQAGQSIGITLQSVTPGTALPNGNETAVHGAILAVRDEGCGIDPAHRDHVFDPYFTTKDATKGSGLGLYNARLFVEDHEGQLSLESAPGKGTTVTIFIPRTGFEEALDEEPAPPPLGRKARARLVLLGVDETDPLVTRLRAEESEVRVLNDLAELKTFFSETKVCPDLLVFASLMPDPQMCEALKGLSVRCQHTRFVHLSHESILPSPDWGDLPVFDLTVEEGSHSHRVALQLLALVPAPH